MEAMRDSMLQIVARYAGSSNDSKRIQDSTVSGKNSDFAMAETQNTKVSQTRNSI
jgi:hypothetical protein